MTDQQHPNPERLWRHRRRLAYAAMGALLCTLGAALFGEVSNPDLAEGLGVVFGFIVIGYYGGNALEAFANRRP